MAFARSCPAPFSNDQTTEPSCHVFEEQYINVGADASITGRVYLNPHTGVGSAKEEMMPARVLIFDPRA